MWPDTEELEASLQALLARERAGARARDEAADEADATRAPSAVAVRVALREADHLAEDVYDAPAALLYALARQDRAPRPLLDRAFAEATLAAARRLGFRLELDAAALAALAADARAGRADYEAVRAAVAAHLDPFGG